MNASCHSKNKVCLKISRRNSLILDGEKEKLVSLVRRIFFSEAKDKEEKKSKSWRCIFTRFKFKQCPALAAPCRTLTEARAEQRKHALTVALATAAAAEAAVAAACAAAEVICLTASPPSSHTCDKGDQNLAAIKIQMAFWGYLLLAEKGKLPTLFGSATLGILLLQDIAVVSLLVILLELESQNLVEESIWPMLTKESLKALGGLGLLSLGGKFLLRRIFEVVVEARSSEAFVALCLLTVVGTSLVTQKLGFSDTVCNLL